MRDDDLQERVDLASSCEGFRRRRRSI